MTDYVRENLQTLLKVCLILSTNVKGHVVVARDPNSDQKFDNLAVNNS